LGHDHQHLSEVKIAENIFSCFGDAYLSHGSHLLEVFLIGLVLHQLENLLTNNAAVYF